MLNANYDDKDKYTEKVTEYDKNGNIKKLQRYGNALIDNLTYTYNGNQLTKVKDESGNASGFTDGASAANEYTYDHNGNLTKDSDKNISTIAYNVLNLPQQVTFSDGSTITYSYAADGTKLRTVHSISGSSTSTQKDYCANVVYEDSVQKLLLTEEGYVDLSATTPAYYYYLKDHQGNNRVIIDKDGAVKETNHYYPFGGLFASTSVQPYKYNGKELDTKKGLNWYDYGARHYDATLGRWLVVDPLAEKMYNWSPYAYCFNNPIKFVDEDGEFPWPALIGSAIEYGLQVYQNYHAGENGYDTWIGNVNFAKVGLSAFNLLGKFKIAKTLLLEGAKETIIFTLNDNAFKTESDVKKIMSNALLNTVVNVGAGKLMEGSDDALIKVNREMNKANQGVRKAKNRTNRQPNSEKNKVLFEKAQINAEQIRKKQVMIQMWNSNSNTLEQTITNGSLLIINNRNEEKTK